MVDPVSFKEIVFSKDFSSTHDLQNFLKNSPILEKGGQLANLIDPIKGI